MVSLRVFLIDAPLFNPLSADATDSVGEVGSKVGSSTAKESAPGFVECRGGETSRAMRFVTVINSSRMIRPVML